MQTMNMIGFKANPAEREKLEKLAKATGKVMSAVLRELICNATIKQVEVVQTSTVLTLESEVSNG